MAESDVPVVEVAVEETVEVAPADPPAAEQVDDGSAAAAGDTGVADGFVAGEDAAVTDLTEAAADAAIAAALVAAGADGGGTLAGEGEPTVEITETVETVTVVGEEPEAQPELIAAGNLGGGAAEQESAVAAATRAAQAQAQAIADRLVQESGGAGGGAAYPVSSGTEHQALGGGQQQYWGDEEGTNKRKFEGEDGAASLDDIDGPMKKRSYLNGTDAQGGAAAEYEGAAPGAEAAGAEYLGGLNPGYSMPPGAEGYSGGGGGGGAEVSDFVDCPRGLVGKLIGRQGATIQSLQTTTGAKIQIDHNTPGEVKKVSISGSAEAVQRARDAIKEVLESDSPSSVPGDVTQTVDCPQGIVGRVIGRGGETIKLLQQNSGAHIVVDQNFPDGVPRKVNINGRPDAVERAVKMVTELITGEPGSAQSVVQKYGFGISRTVHCPKAMVGRVIGKGGETIKSLQRQTTASIQINQQTDPMIITITGSKQAVQTAEMTIRQIVAGDAYPGAALGGGAYQGDLGGPRGAGGYGQPAAYGGGYGAPGAAPGGYGGYGGGYAAPQANAGYGGYYGGGYGGGGYGGAAGSQAAAYGGGYAAGAPGYGGGAGGYGGQADPYASGAGYGGGYGGAQQGSATAATGSIWQELHDDQGRAYYYNTQTGSSQWEKPAEF